MGGNVRVGTRRLAVGRAGHLADSNADQVRRVVSTLNALSLEVATPDETRQMLQLKGKGAVAF